MRSQTGNSNASALMHATDCTHVQFRRRSRMSARSTDSASLQDVGICGVDASQHHERIPLQPASFARFIGDLRNAALNSSWFIASRSSASVVGSLPAITGRGANAGSFSSCANLMFHGQHDWDECPYTHFRIPLSTGRRTLSRTTG